MYKIGNMLHGVSIWSFKNYITLKFNKFTVCDLTQKHLYITNLFLKQSERSYFSEKINSV